MAIYRICPSALSTPGSTSRRYFTPFSMGWALRMTRSLPGISFSAAATFAARRGRAVRPPRRGTRPPAPARR